MTDQALEHATKTHRPAIRRLQLYFWLAIVFVLGGAYRLHLAASLPVGYDEVFVMAVGLNDLQDSAEEALYFLPIRRSNGITPFWWWAQYPTELVGPDLSLFALRLAPVLFGLATIPLTWLLYRRRIGRGPAAIMTTFVACCDILAFCNSRGEFSESLYVPLTICAVALVGVRGRSVVRGLLWSAILLTHFGKGAFIVAVLIAAELLALWLARRVNTKSLERFAVSIGCAAVPVLTWLFLANYYVFGAGPFRTDYRPEEGVVSIWDAIYSITVEYPQTKKAMVADPFDALEPYLDALVWPTTAITGPWILAACLFASTDLFRDRRRLGRRRRMAAALACASIVFSIILVIRGTCAGRFHLMYLPAAWAATSITLWRFRHLRNPAVLVAVLALWSAWIAATCGWLDWHERVWSVARALIAGVCIFIGVFTVWGIVYAWRGSRTFALPAVFVALCVIGAVFAGPHFWGPWSRFEPFRAGDPEQPNLELVALDKWRSGGERPKPESAELLHYLTNFYMRSRGDDDLARAAYFAQRAVDRHPDNPRSWFYLGYIRLQQGAERSKVEAAWVEAIQRETDPESRDKLRARMAQLLARAQNPTTTPSNKN